MAAFDSVEELTNFVGGEPIFSKIGLITKVRNSITKTSMILDTKESGVKKVTTKSQRVTFLRLFHAVIKAAVSVSGLVLDFSDHLSYLALDNNYEIYL